MVRQRDDDVERLLTAQQGAIAAWQLAGLGLPADAVKRLTRSWRRVHQGVWVSGHATLAPAQRWWAAAVTAPGSVVSHASAGAIAEHFPDPTGAVIITRPGGGGRKHHPGLLICHSTLLDGDVVSGSGLPPRTSPARTVLDLMAVLKSDVRRRRCVRDALRQGAVNALALESICRRHPGRRGVARLRAYADEYAGLPATRTRSDAEILALASLVGADVTKPEINVEVAGFECDLSWPDARVIVELDGGSFHQFPSEDERRDRAWSAAGWSVHRLPTDVVYDEPHRLIAVVRRAVSPPNGQN